MNPTLEFAQNELSRYFKRITGKSPEIDLSVSSDLIEVTSLFDDAFDVEITAGKGVYRYLYLLGCRFTAPGAGGEYIPQKDMRECTVSYRGRPSVQHRALCIEGSLSEENILDMIDWLPKAGMNSFFVQFRDAHAFFERWYTHEANVTMQPESYPLSESAVHIRAVEPEIARRGLVYQKIGHGWTCECIGLSGGDWNHVDESRISDENRELLALIGGKRQLSCGIPLNTNLCYSNPEARRRFVDKVVTYARENPHVDILHIWLADERSNLCECENCGKKTPSDWYVLLLNEIDAALTAEGLNTRLVFLLYYALLWPPICEKLYNPARFYMMFAPISRTYSRPFYRPEESVSTAPSGELRRYPLNREVFGTDVHENLEYLYHWQQHFAGESFDFDYHLMWDVFREMGGMKLARVLYEDCRRVKEMRLNGFMSCQLGRDTFPSGLPMYVLGQTLFDNSLSFDAICDEYMRAAYGADAPLAQRYLNLLSDGFSYEYMSDRDKELTEEQYADLFASTAVSVREITPAVQAASQRAQNGPYGRAWRVLEASLGIFSLLAEGLRMKAEKGDLSLRKANLKALRQTAWEAEALIQKDFDALFFEYIVTRFLERDIIACENSAE